MTIYKYDYDEPRQGPVCLKIDKGDGIIFHWNEWHNLYKLSTEKKYNGCDFSAAEKLADAKPNPGITLGPYSKKGVHFFACSKMKKNH